MIETRFSKVQAQCPICLNEEPVTIWQAINGSTDPDLKEKLLRKQLQIQHCSNCGNSTVLSYPLLYLDPERRQMYFCLSGLSEAASREAVEALPDPVGWQLRLVKDYNQLIEKIHIADHHCDDRLIELIKLAVVRQGEYDIKDGCIYFLTADDHNFRFMTAQSDGQWYTLDLESETYLNAEQLVPNLPELAGQWQTIGQDYARQLLKRLAGDEE
jgi:hypothetical protein